MLDKAMYDPDWPHQLGPGSLRCTASFEDPVPPSMDHVSEQGHRAAGPDHREPENRDCAPRQRLQAIEAYNGDDQAELVGCGSLRGTVGV